MNRRHTSALLAVLAAAILFGTGGAVIKASSLSAWQIGALRSLIACLVLVVALPEVRRGWTRAVWLAGLPYAGVMLLFVHANTLTTAGTTTLLQASAPLYVAILGPFVLGERPTRDRLLVLPLFVLGVALLLVAPEAASDLARDPSLGRWVAAAAGACYGLVLLALRRFEGGDERGTGLRAVACGNLIAAAVGLPFVGREGLAVSGADLLILVYLGAIQIGLAYLLLVPAMRVLPAFDVSLLLLLEPVASPIFAWLVHRERLGPATLTGGALIVLACALQARLASRRPASPPRPG